MQVLGIETSCDETAAAVVGPDGLITDVTFSQVVHKAYGGVVPELASRAHVERITAVVDEALTRAGLERPDAVAATSGPGLIGAVLVGLSYAKALAFGWGVPFIGINHLEGHLLSPRLDRPDLPWPFLALVVSGGHTSLYFAESVGTYQTLAETIDDAAGEAFDKVARMLGLGYPGGPAVDALAKQGDPASIPLPRPRAPGLNMSFSGLKTAVRNAIERNPHMRAEDMAASFQHTVSDILADRVQRAANQTGCRTLAVSGGVAANSGLRTRLSELDLDVHIPPIRFCTDNGAMIAHAGRLRLLNGDHSKLDTGARAVWPLDEA